LAAILPELRSDIAFALSYEFSRIVKFPNGRNPDSVDELPVGFLRQFALHKVFRRRNLNTIHRNLLLVFI